MRSVTVKDMLGEEFFCRCPEPSLRIVFFARRTSVVIDGRPPPKRVLRPYRKCGACGRPIYNPDIDKVAD